MQAVTREFEPWMDAQDVAKLIGCTLQSVYRLARLGILPAVRLGRQVRFDPETIREFVRNGGKTLESVAE